MSTTAAGTLLWTPSTERKAASRMAEFAALASERVGRPLAAYPELHAWSLEDPEGFWGLVWEYAGLHATTPFRRVRSDPARMGAPRPPGTAWFEGARLNFAQNLLRHGRTAPDEPALIAVHESGDQETVTWAELSDRVAVAS